MTHRTLASLFAFTLLAAGHSTAQDGAAAQNAQTDVVAQACAKMQNLKGVAFSTMEEQDAAMMRRFRNMIPQEMRETEVAGNWAEGMLHVSLNFDDDEAILHGGRMIARREGGPWRPRQRVLANGQPLPFVFDPGLFFEMLGGLAPDSRKIIHESTKQVGESEMQVVGMTLTGDAALDLVLGGALPKVSGGGMMMIGAGAPGMQNTEAPKVSLDLALYVDADGLVHRVKARAYQEAGIDGNVMIEVQGADDFGNDEAEEKVEEFDENGDRIYKHGLPVRALKSDVSLGSLDVRLSKHGQPGLPELDAAARRMLKLQ